MTKTLHFPGTGLKSRPFDAYDEVCERYYRAGFSNERVRRECEAELRGRFGSDDLDWDWTHGKNIARRYKVEYV